MRITIKDLRILANRLNVLTDSPVEYGNNHFHIDSCNGGYRLSRICETGSGEYDLSPRVGARELYNIIRGVLKGLEITFPYKFDEYRKHELSKVEFCEETTTIKFEGKCRNISISRDEFNKIAKILGGN